MQILILGMHRSGTSAIARIINMMGAYFAPEGAALPPGNDNPKGFWERKDVMALNDSLLRLQHCRWHELARWQPEKAAHAAPELRPPMQALIKEMDAHQPWFLKDPRFCLTLPAWLPLLKSPLAVLVYRNPLEIALSLHRRNNLPLEYALALWEYYIVQMLNASMYLTRICVAHGDVLARPVLTCQALHAQLVEAGVQGLILPANDDIRNFIDPSLYRARGQDGQLALSPAQHALSEILQGIRPHTAPLAVSPPSLALLRAGLPVTSHTG